MTNLILFGILIQLSIIIFCLAKIGDLLEERLKK